MYSPFQSKLGTNYRARDDEVPQIRSLLVQPLSRMQEIDTEIADLHNAIDALLTEKATLRSYIRAHRTLIAPIRRIPPEILSEIFVTCLPKERNCVMSATEAPMLLGRVCSSWRSLSHSIPRLWCRLHIVEPELNSAWTQLVWEQKYVQRADAAKTWLERSGPYPLSISLTGSDEDRRAMVNSQSSGTTAAILQVLIPFAHRWQNISVQASPADLECLLSISEQDVPMLTRLHIHRVPSPAGPMQLPALQFLNGRQIAHCSFSGSHGRNILSLPVRWSQLRSLSIGGNGRSLTTEAAVKVLSRCPRLETCELTIVHMSPPSASTATIVTLPHLRALTVNDEGPHAAYKLGGLFSCLSLPGLLNLEVLGSYRSSVTGSAASFASLPRLESFTIITALFTKPTLITLLVTLPPTIQQLHLSSLNVRRNHAHMDDDVLAMLNPSIFPNLEELRITECNSVSDQALFRFIVAMMRVDWPALRIVKVHFKRSKQMEIPEEIQSLMDAGLQVIIDYQHRYHAPLRSSPWKGLPDEYKAETAQLTSRVRWTVSAEPESDESALAAFSNLTSALPSILQRLQD
ncbi:hypothetical protein R3P38DRAFT_3048515 [Favolaschia claudopus]|uniref:F-box domain-containing protein n=1 Tax=Favolaschia claudopus TaxID=2862362 RepID=A0AAW0A5H9_9AGAR